MYNLTDHPLWPYDQDEDFIDNIIDDIEMMEAEYKIEKHEKVP